MALQVHQFICLSDNFGILIHDPATGATATIDAPEAGPVLAALAEKGWTLTDILVTHHHPDHIQGIPEVKAKFPKARVVGAKADAHRIPGLDVQVVEGDEISVGSATARVIETPGHTTGHISFHFADDALLFAGDTLFSLGCGRAFEAPAPILYRSLEKLAALPEETRQALNRELAARNFSGYEALEDWLRDQGFEISKSAIHRYGQKIERRMQAIKASTEAAKMIVEAAGDDQDARSESVIALVQTEMFDSIIAIQEAGDEDGENKLTPAERLGMMSKAAKNIAKVEAFCAARPDVCAPVPRPPTCRRRYHPVPAPPSVAWTHAVRSSGPGNSPV